MKNYKLTSEFKVTISGKKLFRIECIKDFKYAKKGDKGGFVEKESNLSDNAWVSGNACVSDNAWVSGNARVSDDARVSGNARVRDNAWVSDDAWVSGNARVRDNAWVSGNARVSGNACVSGNARVSGNACVSGNAISTKNVFTLNFVYDLTLTDNHIKYGCIQKKVSEWIDWLKSEEEFETKRNTEKFKLIEMALNLAIEQHKQLTNE